MRLLVKGESSSIVFLIIGDISLFLGVNRLEYKQGDKDDRYRS